MKIYGVAFSNKGKELLNRIKNEGSLSDEFIIRDNDISLEDFVSSAFENRIPVIFVGACGIATRLIAPHLKSKLEDPPIIVVDELGQFVIPILSGHVGGANELAYKIASICEAIPVITTATDINGTFAIDNWAKANNLSIVNKEGIAKVSSAVLEGKAITVSIKDYPPKERVNVIIDDSGDMTAGGNADLYLKKKKYTVGIGCRKGKSFDEVERSFIEALDAVKLKPDDIYAIGTIDIKENEPAILSISQKYRIPIISFTASLLENAPGEYSESAFVKDTVGVGNVCERAAILAAGVEAKLILPKQAGNGVTMAVAGCM